MKDEAIRQVIVEGVKDGVRAEAAGVWALYSRHEGNVDFDMIADDELYMIFGKARVVFSMLEGEFSKIQNMIDAKPPA